MAHLSKLVFIQRTALSNKGLAHNLITIVEHVLENGEVSNSKVKLLLKVSKSTATRYLDELEGVYLDRKGETGKGTIYTIKGLSKGS